MTFEAVNCIVEAEENAKKSIANATVQARQMAVDARESGKAVVDAALKKAAKVRKEMSEEAQETARANSVESRKETEAHVAALRAIAEKNLDQAAGFIVERITKE